MLVLLIGFLSIAAGVMLFTPIVQFSDQAYNATQSSTNPMVKNVGPLTGLIPLVWLFVTIAGGLALVGYGAYGAVKKRIG